MKPFFDLPVPTGFYIFFVSLFSRPNEKTHPHHLAHLAHCQLPFPYFFSNPGMEKKYVSNHSVSSQCGRTYFLQNQFYSNWPGWKNLFHRLFRRQSCKF